MQILFAYKNQTPDLLGRFLYVVYAATLGSPNTL